MAKKKKPLVPPALQWTALGGLVFLAVGGWIWATQFGSADHIVNVTVPNLSAQARQGRQVFDANCAACHGPDAGGTPQGPPLIHKIYEPNHHADGSFLLAVRRGVRQHHWSFGNMPPQPQIERADLAAILSYVREVQRANGIF